jgi:subtilisin family serine protease
MIKSCNRALLIFIPALLAVGIFAWSSSASSGSISENGWRSKVSPDLLEEFDKGGDPGSLRDVIITTAGKPGSQHSSAVLASGGSVKDTYGVINGISARLPLHAIEALTRRNDFAFISKDRPITVFGHLENTTGAAQIRNLISSIPSLNGAGVGIAILDSGIYSSHHEISYNGVSRISVNVDAGGFGNATDYGGHGTHVASIACGTNHVGPGAYTGVAPGATIINVKVLDRTGTGYTSNIINAINWCVSYRYAYNIKVMNLSLGAPAVDSYQNDPVCRAVRAAHDAGIVVVVAAGNDGKDQNGNKLYGTIHSPGTEPSAITVGASNTFGTDSRADDVVTTYSSRGPTRGYYTDALGNKIYDNLIKPDLVAPGNKIIGAEAYGCTLITDHPELDANVYETNTYHYVMYMSGTSVAAPVVSGAAALLLQANPSLTPNLVKAILIYSAQPLKGYNTLEQGAGELNIDGAVRLANTIKNPLSGLTNGQPLLSGALPAQESTIAGQTFHWGQGVITNYTFLYDSDLMNNWQGMYGQGVLLSDGTYVSAGVILKKASLVTPGVSVSNGVVLSDGMLMTSGTLLSSGVALSDGALLSDNTAFCDGVIISDGRLLADGVIISDSVAYTALGDPGLCSTPLPDATVK